MYLIDTNIHASFLLQTYEKDPVSTAYTHYLNTIALSERVITDFILGEFETFIIQVVPSRLKLNSIDKKKLKQLAYDYIDRITHNCTLITPQIQTLHKARDMYFDNYKTHYLSFVDCLILATAQENTYTILTKDIRMNTIAKQLHIQVPKVV